MNGFAVDPPALQAASSAFEAHAADLQQIYNKLHDDLARAGKPWRSAPFDNNYEPRKENSLKQFENIVRGVTSTADALSQWGANYANAGQADAQSARTLFP